MPQIGFQKYLLTVPWFQTYIGTFPIRQCSEVSPQIELFGNLKILQKTIIESYRVGWMNEWVKTTTKMRSENEVNEQVLHEITVQQQNHAEWQRNYFANSINFAQLCRHSIIYSLIQPFIHLYVDNNSMKQWVCFLYLVDGWLKARSSEGRHLHCLTENASVFESTVKGLSCDENKNEPCKNNFNAMSCCGGISATGVASSCLSSWNSFVDMDDMEGWSLHGRIVYAANWNASLLYFNAFFSLVGKLFGWLTCSLRSHKICVVVCLLVPRKKVLWSNSFV